MGACEGDGDGMAGGLRAVELVLGALGSPWVCSVSPILK